MVVIRERGLEELSEILRVEREAFGEDSEVALTDALMHDESAGAWLSLVAYEDNRAVGHILFTRCSLAVGDPSLMLLAPLAVVPEHQRQGVGEALIGEGLALLKARGVVAVFVLGHPSYYPRHGFLSCAPYGLKPPYYDPIQDEAWMIQLISDDPVAFEEGTVQVAGTLMHEEMWRE